MLSQARQPTATVTPQRPSAYLHGGFVLPMVALWIASSSSRSFGLPAMAGFPQITIDRLCLIVLLIYALVMVGTRKPRLRARIGLEITLWVLGCCIAVSGYTNGSFGPDPANQIYVFNAWIFPAIVVSLILRSRLTERDVARFAILLTCFALYLGLTAVFERLSIRWALVPAAIGDPTKGIHFGRSRGPFLQAAFNGTVIVMLVPIAMLLLQLPHRRWKVLGVVTTLLLCVGTYLTATRAAMLGLAGVFLIGGILASPSRRSYRVFLASLGVTALLLAIGGAPVVPRFEEPSSSKDRFDLLLATGEMFLAHPIVGIGYGNFDRFQVDFFNRGQHFGGVAFNDKFWEGASHNTLLTPFAEMGTVVGVMGIGLLLSRLLVGFRPTPHGVSKRLSRHPVMVAGGLMVVAFMINGVFVELRFTATPTLLLWSFAALVERYSWILQSRLPTQAAAQPRPLPADGPPGIPEPAGAA